ncbi:MAG: hypothetical protein Q4C81_09580 [Kocuria sp.]|nr:hypothetical protein [Kocuria sp.]
MATFGSAMAMANLAGAFGRLSEESSGFHVLDILFLISLTLMLVVLPAALWGIFLPWPRFLLPRWIRVRLKAGDPVRTAQPLVFDDSGEVIGVEPEPDDNPVTVDDLDDLLPYVAKVQVVRWWVSAVLCLGTAAGLIWVLFLPFMIGYNSMGGMTRAFWPLVPFVLVFCAVVGVYYVYGAARPEHVTIDDQGVSTRSWSVPWSRITGVTGTKARLYLRVYREDADRIRPANRWHSGSPGGFGGLLGSGNFVGLQMSLRKQHHVQKIIEAGVDRRRIAQGRPPVRRPI